MYVEEEGESGGGGVAFVKKRDDKGGTRGDVGL